MHEDVDRQIIGGMSGGIVVEGSDRLYPFVKDLTERVVLLKHHPIGRADYEELVTVNGTVTPTIPIRPGEAQFWQIGNIGADRFLRLKIDGMPFYLIGRDGYFLPRPIRMEEVLLGPGQRFSAIVVGGQTGRHAFQSVAFKFDERQSPLPEVNLGTVVSDGPPADIAATEAKVSMQHVNGQLYVDMVRSSPVAQRRTFAFSVNPQKTAFFINDQVFDENRTDVTVKLGDTEEWTILNKDSQYHDFHIHQTGFLVTEVNGAAHRFRWSTRHVQCSSPAKWETRRSQAHYSFHQSGNCGPVRVSLPRRKTRGQRHDDDGRSGPVAFRANRRQTSTDRPEKNLLEPNYYEYKYSKSRKLSGHN